MEVTQEGTSAGKSSRPQNPLKRSSVAPTHEEQQEGDHRHQNGRQSPRSFESNKTLQGLLAYWQELQDMSTSNPPYQEAQWRDEGWEDLGDGIQRHESRDVEAQNDGGHDHHAAAAMDEDDAPRHWLPRSPPRDATSSPLQPSLKHHHPGALRSLMRTARTPSPPYDSQDERYMPPSPPYSAGSAAGDNHNGHDVHHHHHIHHHEHHHTSHRRRHRSRTPAPQVPQQEAVTDQDHERADISDEFWNALQASGGIHWDVRKKRGDRLVVREYVGPVLDSQGETSWSHLTVSGSVWTSLPRKFCSRSVLLDLPYDFKEDEQYFHIIEELEYVS